MKKMALPPLANRSPASWRQAMTFGDCLTGASHDLASWRGHQWEPSNLAADIDYDILDHCLCISISGPLDLRCAFRLLAIAQAVDDSITQCVLDLTGVTQIFDSGVAALILLTQELTKRGIGGIRTQGLHIDSTSLSPYATGSVPATLRRVFVWSPPAILDQDPLVMPIEVKGIAINRTSTGASPQIVE